MNLTVIIPTSMRRDNPSTDHIEQAIESINSMMGLKNARKIIVCDGFHKRAGNASKYSIDRYGEMNKCLYAKYKAGLYGLDAEIIECEDHVNLSGVVCRGIKEANTENILIFQHDFVVVKPVDTESIVAEISRDKTPIKHIRLNKRANIIAGYDWVLVDDALPIPALKTTAWSDNPHFMTKTYHYKYIEPFIKNARTYPESVIMPKYAYAITMAGFYKAHEIYGTYVYGKYNEGAYIRHLE